MAGTGPVSRYAVPPVWLLALVGPILFATAIGAQAPAETTSPSAPVLSTDAEREAFLKTARVVRTRSAGKGVTNTLRATLSDGTITHDASIQAVDQAQAVFQGTRGTELNFKDSWRFNLAAYHLDRLLELNMIPVTVERRHQTKPSSFTWWVDDVLMDEGQRLRSKRVVPDTRDWNEQMWLTRLFDQLIANVDRNLGNLLIDTRWTIWMIDHSRAFRLNKDLRSPESLSKIDRGLLERLRRIDQADVQRVAGTHLQSNEIEALLARRDRIVAHFDKAGEAGVFERKAR